ncbi:hypothetical protein TNIN_473401, partial [Trichonephila inaurata madagascariensis]
HLESIPREKKTETVIPTFLVTLILHVEEPPNIRSRSTWYLPPSVRTGEDETLRIQEKFPRIVGLLAGSSRSWLFLKPRPGGDQIVFLFYRKSILTYCTMLEMDADEIAKLVRRCIAEWLYC